MALVHEGIVVGKLDEWTLPERFDLLYFSNDSLNRLDLVGRRNPHGCRAEFAAERTPSLRLHRESVVALRIEQLKPRHRRLVQIEASVSRIVYLVKPSARF